MIDHLLFEFEPPLSGLLDLDYTFLWQSIDQLRILNCERVFQIDFEKQVYLLMEYVETKQCFDAKWWVSS